MQTTEYCVGNHTFRIHFSERDAGSLLPSFIPFLYRISDKEKPLFELTITPDFRPSRKGDYIGEFDCGSADFDVYHLPDGGYQFLISNPGGRFNCFLQTDEKFTQGKAAIHRDVQDESFYINNCVMLMYAFSAAPCHTLLMHASVIRNSNRGFLFLGISGTGKSTHSDLWLKHIEGSELMNDDNPVICFTPDGVPHVFGSPWSGKTPCYKNIEAPIGALVHIKQDKENRIERKTVLEAFSSLVISCSTMRWDERIFRHTCDAIAMLIERVPIYQLSCRPDEEAARVCSNTLLI